MNRPLRTWLVVPVLAALALAASPQLASATQPLPPNLYVTCDTLTLHYWLAYSDHDGHYVYQSLQAHPDQPYGTYTQIATLNGTGHPHTYYAPRPQAYSVRYYVTTYQGLEESDPSNVVTCYPDVKWAAGAETTPTVSEGTGTDDGEWAGDDLNLGGFGLDIASLPNSPVLKGIKSYKCSAQTNSSNSDDRCERAQGNTSTSNMTVDKIWASGDEYWLTTGFYLASGYSFCDTSCSKDYDGGAITQEKQLGSCGNPISTLAVVNDPADGSIMLQQNNDQTNTCQYQGDTQALWEVPIETGRWIKVLRHFSFSPDPAVGFIESYVDTDGNSTTTWKPVSYGDLTTVGQNKSRQQPSPPNDITLVSDPPAVERILTWTLKQCDASYTPPDADHCPGTASTPSKEVCTYPGNWPCGQARIGIYRNGLITGTSTVYHDGIVMGADPGDTVDVAF